MLILVLVSPLISGPLDRPDDMPMKIRQISSQLAVKPSTGESITPPHRGVTCRPDALRGMKAFFEGIASYSVLAICTSMNLCSSIAFADQTKVFLIL